MFFYNGNNSEFLRHVLENHPIKSNLIVYAPPPHKLNDDIMERMRKSSSVMLVNYRGRLLHDLVTSMREYKKERVRGRIIGEKRN